MKPKTQSKKQQDSPALVEEIRLARMTLASWGNTQEDITPAGIRAILSALETLIEASEVHQSLNYKGGK